MTESKKQTILLEDKCYLKITGVNGVLNLTENYAEILIGDEHLEIKGSNLKCETLSVDNGDLVIIGNIYSLKYKDVKEKKGIFKRIFK